MADRIRIPERSLDQLGIVVRGFIDYGAELGHRPLLIGLGSLVEVRNLVDDLGLRRRDLVLVRRADRLRGVRSAVVLGAPGWDLALDFGDAREVAAHLALVERVAGRVHRFELDDGFHVDLIG